jgi:hypothetical protein
MNSDTRFDLTINSTDAPHNTASVSSDDLDDVMRLLDLAGQGNASRVFNAAVTKFGMPDGASTMTVASNDKADVLRLLQLAGVIVADSQPCGCQGACACADSATTQADANATIAATISSLEPAVMMMEQQAEYDFGHRDPTAEQTQFDIKDYNFKGRGDIPERLTSARFGSNPLKSEMHESVFQRMVEAYQAYLQEGEDRENSDGRASPLTANNRDEFLKDPFTTEPTTDGSESPLSTIKRQHINR